jgi:hypothetical protein
MWLQIQTLDVIVGEKAPVEMLSGEIEPTLKEAQDHD